MVDQEKIEPCKYCKEPVYVGEPLSGFSFDTQTVVFSYFHIECCVSSEGVDIPV